MSAAERPWRNFTLRQRQAGGKRPAAFLLSICFVLRGHTRGTAKGWGEVQSGLAGWGVPQACWTLLLPVHVWPRGFFLYSDRQNARYEEPFPQGLTFDLDFPFPIYFFYYIFS